jgi:hypothetical protein
MKEPTLAENLMKEQTLAENLMKDGHWLKV